MMRMQLGGNPIAAKPYHLVISTNLFLFCSSQVRTEISIYASERSTQQYRPRPSISQSLQVGAVTRKKRVAVMVVIVGKWATCAAQKTAFTNAYVNGSDIICQGDQKEGHA